MKLTSLVALLFALAGCTASTDRSTDDVPAGTTAPTGTPASSRDTSAAAAGALRSEADARRVLRAVYRPLHTFYQRMDTSGTGEARPPAGMRTPEALADTLAQTMASSLARSFSAQLLMQRGGGYIVRPTEKIITPYEGGPALEAVTVTQENGAYDLTERYVPSELYGQVERHNTVRRENGRWRLTSVTYGGGQR